MSRARDGGSGEHPGELLTLHVDGDLTEAERRRVEDHLAECDRCRRVVRDLESLAERAGRLPDRGPDEDLWPGVAAEIGAEPAGDAGDGAIPLLRRRWRVGVTRAAAAAALVAALASGVTWGLTRSDPVRERTSGVAMDDGGRATASPGTAAPGRSAVRWAALDQTPRGVARLETRYEEGREELDPATRRMLDRNLRLIDRAIAEARRALLEQPDNSYLHQHLSRTMRRKAQFLSVAVRMTEAD